MIEVFDLLGGNLQLRNGYSAILPVLRKAIPDHAVRLKHTVTKIIWKRSLRSPGGDTDFDVDEGSEEDFDSDTESSSNSRATVIAGGKLDLIAEEEEDGGSSGARGSSAEPTFPSFDDGGDPPPLPPPEQPTQRESSSGDMDLHSQLRELIAKAKLKSKMRSASKESKVSIRLYKLVLWVLRRLIFPSA